MIFSSGIMLDALLSIALDRVVPVLQPKMGQVWGLFLGFDDGVKFLTDKLRNFRNAIEDAERREVKDEAVRNWLERLGL